MQILLTFNKVDKTKKRLYKTSVNTEMLYNLYYITKIQSLY